MEKENLTQSRFIVTLNFVDLLTLSSVITTSISVGLTLAGYFHLAVSLLFLAMFADAFDGILARKYQLERNFGRYLDGFMDVLIYLVSPALIWYQIGFDGFYSVFLIAFIAAGCIRLSVFNDIGNIQESNGLSYLGLPVFWSVFLLGISLLSLEFFSPSAIFPILAICLFAFAYCMLIRRPFFKFKSIIQIVSITLGGASVFLIMALSDLLKINVIQIIAIALVLQIPIVIGGVLHMVVVKGDYLTSLKVPVHETLFGKNKTWRGVIVMPLLAALGGMSLMPIQSFLEPYLFSDVNLIALGFLAGVGYIIAELPNSYIKRRLGIKAGEASSRFPLLFIAMDQLDSAIGVAVMYALLGLSLEISIAYVLTFPLVALLVKQGLFYFRLKESRV